MDEVREQMEKDIYETLKAIEVEEEVRLSDKAFITDTLAGKLIGLGYRLIDLDKLKVLGDEEKLSCSLVSQYPFYLIKDVIDETCEHQLDDIKRQLGGL